MSERTRLLDRVVARLATWDLALRGIGVAIAIVALVVQWAKLVHRPDGDFRLHWEFGRRFAQHEFLYRDEFNIPYPPFWGLVHAPLTVMPEAVAHVVVYFPMFVGALVVLLWVLDRLTRRALPLSSTARFWATAGALALASQYLFRDMVEAGVNLALVALAWVGIYCWTRRREWVGGAVLGFAIACKCTPGVFLIYFIAKRQWKMAAATTLAAGLFTLSPILWMGGHDYAMHIRIWLDHARQGMGKADPISGIVGQEKVQNMALRPAIGRLLMQVPMPDVAPWAQRLYVDFLNLSPVAAGRITRGLMLALLIWIAWRWRRGVQDRTALDVVWKCAGVSLLLLLYSPITWTQHAVGVLPACYLLMRSRLTQRTDDADPLAKDGLGMPWPTAVAWVVAAFVVFNVVLSRDLIGKDLALIAFSYHLQTWTIVALLLAVKVMRGRVASRERVPAAALAHD